jgi:hypothetical protein
VPVGCIQSRKLWIGGLTGLVGALCFALTGPSQVRERATFLYTETPKFEATAWLRAAERFPEGSQIRVAAGDAHRNLIDGFFATADPQVSFDGLAVVFAGKRRQSDPWQIWEVPLNGGQPVQITNGTEDCIRPLYLPGGRFVFARKYGATFQLAVLAEAGAEPERISFAPGNVVPSQILNDGRILFEGAHPMGSEGPVELYAVYSDGSGVESLRCDHGREHRDARQLASGDVIFAGERGLGRFTSAHARQLAVTSPGAEIAGPIAELGPERWLVSLRFPGSRTFALYEWPADAGARPLLTRARHVVQPVVAASRTVPPRHPSALHNRPGANLLCLNAYESPLAFTEGSIANVRVYTRDAGGKPALLGETSVESDGSFFVQVPTERPVRIELTGRSGKRLAGEAGWFWMRRGEQRICVGCHAGPERAPDNAAPKILTRITAPVSMLPPGGAK